MASGWRNRGVVTAVRVLVKKVDQRWRDAGGGEGVDMGAVVEACLDGVAVSGGGVRLWWLCMGWCWLVVDLGFSRGWVIEEIHCIQRRGNQRYGEDDKSLNESLITSYLIGPPPEAVVYSVAAGEDQCYRRRRQSLSALLLLKPPPESTFPCPASSSPGSLSIYAPGRRTAFFIKLRFPPLIFKKWVSMSKKRPPPSLPPSPSWFFLEDSKSDPSKSVVIPHRVFLPRRKDRHHRYPPHHRGSSSKIQNRILQNRCNEFSTNFTYEITSDRVKIFDMHTQKD
ncbi:hypothetical protein L2E82_35634 [Cichorium intybus]|uniref:Uncharacterized protein n=1 Tax=Cichorium intybus TaxID=13427 RepID=A0ACB9BPE0_CICIN|nr:hypothetical protein L2E82_35634 [Cichorium intybus]